MGVYAQFKVGSHGPHFNGEYTLSYQFTCAGTGDSHSEDALGFGINDQFGHAVAAIESCGPARSPPWKSRDFDRPALFPGLGFSQPAPGHFGIGEDHGRDGARFKSRRASADRF